MSLRFVILCGAVVVLLALSACGAPDAAWDATRKTLNGETFDPVPQDPVAPSDRIRLDHPSHRGGEDSLDAATPANAGEPATTEATPAGSVRQPFEASSPVAPVPARERPVWHRGDVLR